MGNDSVRKADEARLDSTNPAAGRLPDDRATERALGSNRQVEQIAVGDQLGRSVPSVAPAVPTAATMRRIATVSTVSGTAVLLCCAAVTADAPLAAVITIAALLPATVVDIYDGRLPNAPLGLAAVALVTALTIGTIGGATWPIASVCAGLAAAILPMLILHVASPDALGFGDVKAAAVLGAAVGVVDWRLAIVMLALAAGSAVVIASMLRRRSIAFGPPLVVGASAALAIHPSVLGVLGS
ncbi:MAG: prepilin peptidase [Actinomycetota bacterium]